MKNSSVSPEIEVMAKELSGKLTYSSQMEVLYRIAYPQITGVKTARTVNRWYTSHAMSQLNALKQKRPTQSTAVITAGGKGSQKLPEVDCAFDVMYSQNGFLSLIIDRYDWFGCQGSAAQRVSQTWDLRLGRMLPLNAFFKQGSDWQRLIYKNIDDRLIETKSLREGTYYGDCIQRVRKHFNPQSYYLADDGVVVYFQRGLIGPHNAGIPSFLIPYADFGAMLNTPL